MAKMITPLGSRTYMDDYEQAANRAAQINASMAQDEARWRGSGDWQDTRQAMQQQAAAMAAQAMAQQAASEADMRRQERQETFARQDAAAQRAADLTREGWQYQAGREDARYDRSQAEKKEQRDMAKWQAMIESDLLPEDARNFAWQQLYGEGMPGDAMGTEGLGPAGIAGPFRTNPVDEMNEQAVRINEAISSPVLALELEDLKKMAGEVSVMGDDSEFVMRLQDFVARIAELTNSSDESVMASVLPLIRGSVDRGLVDIPAAANLAAAVPLVGPGVVAGGHALNALGRWAGEATGLVDSNEEYLRSILGGSR